MPDIGNGVPHDAVRAVQAAAELADGGLAERMRVDAGVRLLVTARRLASALPRAARPSAAEAVVMRVARGWDTSATTAAEYVETLPVADLDAFLTAGPAWAAEQRDRVATAPELIRRAA